ncbi:hypothetical protein KHQ81_15380 (plasmid) [Mycoplasmatota bacterium]|nr:hypothetical protein KHQ81_15380 [Mycoplasmatota bacterium]
MIVKIRYRNVNPKDNFMGDYMKYIEKGGKLSLDTKESLFKDSFGDVFKQKYNNNEDKFAEDLSDNFLEDYEEYIENRKGSQVLFSDVGIDINEMKNSFSKKSSGVVYFPIISLKENEALQYNFTQEVMIEKAREIAHMFKRDLKLDSSTFEWICAYHEKPEENQNPEAGKMPHLHFMLYSPNQVDGYHPITYINKLRKKAIDIFYREHQKATLEKREEKIKEIKKFTADKKLYQEFKERLDTLYTTLVDVNKGKGKTQYKALETNRDILIQIKKDLHSNKTLSEQQLDFLDKNQIDKNIEEIDRHINLFNNLFNQVSSIINDVILKTPPYDKVYKEYIDFSKELRSIYGTGKFYEKLINDDKEKIFNKLKNVVIRMSISKYIESKNKYYINEERFLNTMFNGFPLIKLNKNQSTDICSKITKVLFTLDYDLDKIKNTLDHFIKEKGHSKYIKSTIEKKYKDLTNDKTELNSKGKAYKLDIDEIKNLTNVLDRTKLNAWQSFYRNQNEEYLNKQVDNLQKYVDYSFISSFRSFLHPVQSDHWDLIKAERKVLKMDYLEEMKKNRIQRLLSYGIDIRI